MSKDIDYVRGHSRSKRKLTKVERSDEPWGGPRGIGERHHLLPRPALHTHPLHQRQHRRQIRHLTASH
jgi:hypothetical protein